MDFPSDLTTLASVYHLPTGAGKQPYPATPSVTIRGVLLPIDRKDHALEGGAYTDPHEFYVNVASDVRESDKLVIGGVTYYARKVFVANAGGLKHKRVSLSTQ